MIIKEERLTETFKRLAVIDSVSKKENAICREIQSLFASMGAETYIDDTGNKIDGDTGNLIVKFKGNTDAVPLLFNAHMDTVEPGEGIKVIFKDGIFTSDGQTILGADDKSGIAILIEVMHTILENRMAHGPVEMVFTVSEEIGILGAKHFDADQIKSKYGYALDNGDVDGMVVKSPEALQFRIKVHGKDSHAGAEPEKGINAIHIASKAIAEVHIGRIDSETTCNIGVIKGGIATNIVPNLVTVKGEVRSHNPKTLKATTDKIFAAFGRAIEKSKKSPKDELPRMEVTTETEFPLTDFPETHPVVTLVRRAAENLGRNITLKTSGGGSDANIFFGKGIEMVVLGTGMQDIHTVRESIRLADMVKAAELTIEIIKTHAATSQ